MTDEAKPTSSIPVALRHWREAERAVAVARRGKLAAQNAAVAAEEAVAAAIATAEASKQALNAAALAEASAAKTAAAARVLAEATQVDLIDADADNAIADVDEAEARATYQHLAGQAAERQMP